jgi:hypothetical protein
MTAEVSPVNLFDIDAEYGDVLTLGEMFQHIQTGDPQ